MRCLSYIVFCLLSFLMCTDQRKDLLPELSYAESLMQYYPDKAMAVLDSMEIPSPLDKYQYATWCLLITQARDKNFVRHTSDSLINIALDYFIKQDDMQRKATVLYYEGRVNHDLPNAEKAIDYYLQARDAAMKTIDLRLLYLINSQLGTLYAYRDLTDLAFEAYKKANIYAIQLKDSTFISNSYSYLGRITTFNNDLPGGLDYYKKAIEIAEQSESLNALTLAYAEISIVFHAMSMLDSSMHYLKKSMMIEEMYNASVLSPTYLGIGETYYAMGQSDSAKFYLEKAINTTNLYTKQDATAILYNLCKDSNKYEDAIKYNEQYWVYKDSIDNVNQSTKIVGIQAKYDQVRLLNINNQLENRILWGVVIILLIISVMIYFYQQKLVKKERTIKENKELLQERLIQLQKNESIILENKNLIESLNAQIGEHAGSQELIDDQKSEIERIQQDNATLQTQNEVLQEDIEKYKPSLKKEGEVLKTYESLAVENANLSERQRYLCSKLIKHIKILDSLKSNPKYIEESQWSEIYDSINIVYPNLIDHWRKDLLLSDSELLMCCLIKMQLNNTCIATLTGISSASVTKRKQRLKERINKQLKSQLNAEISVDTYLGWY